MTSVLEELCITLTQFFHLCEMSPHGNIADEVCREMLAMDEYLAFKDIMGQQHSDLESECRSATYHQAKVGDKERLVLNIYWGQHGLMNLFSIRTKCSLIQISF